MTGDHPLDALEFSTRVRKRAQYEAFTFSLLPDGRGVQIRNESHADPEHHTYDVDVEAGVPTSCSCPADERFDGACKHRVTVAMRTPVREALAIGATVADGGCPGRAPHRGRRGGEPAPQSTLDHSDGEDDDAEDECAACTDSFPCWPCVRDGRRSLPR